MARRSSMASKSPCRVASETERVRWLSSRAGTPCGGVAAWDRPASPRSRPAARPTCFVELSRSIAAPDKAQLDLQHAGSAGIVQVDPVLFDAEADRGAAAEVEAHAAAHLVGELIDSLGGLHRGADVAIPGIPEAARGGAAVGDIGVD